MIHKLQACLNTHDFRGIIIQLFEFLLARYCESRLSARKAAVRAASDDCAQVNTNLPQARSISPSPSFRILDHVKEKNIHMTFYVMIEA
jgi:hypothetical protein